MTVSRTEIMRTMRAKGVSLKEIGEQFGVSDSRVAQLIQMPLAKAEVSKAKTESMRAMLKAGSSIAEIADQLSVSVVAVRKRLNPAPEKPRKDYDAAPDAVIVPKWVKNPTLRERYLNIAERHDEHVAASIIRTAMRSGVTL